MTTRQQLELGIEPVRDGCRAPLRRRRVERAHWWFAQMRRVVHEAPDWSTRPAAAPAGAADPSHN